MLIIAGLGNPGAKYAGNRHNIGFMAVDAIQRRPGFSPWSKKFKAEISEGDLAGEKVEGSAGGGMVTVTANGQGDVVAVRIDPEVMKGDDVEMLEDLVLAAVNEALRRSKELAAERMGRITGGLGSMGLF